ncbi:MAG: ferrous iron transport protein B [Zavarzinella sp.]
MKPSLRIALIGNPNTGKSTLFNRLTGLRQHVGNYPGVTVDIHTGKKEFQGQQFEFIDLPGTYSLSARSPDEMLTLDLCTGTLPQQPPPDVVVSIVDAANLDRHLYLTTQLLDIGIPLVLVVNMIDVAEQQQIRIDYQKLAAQLGIPVVPVRADRGEGIDKLLEQLAHLPPAPTTKVDFPPPVVAAIENVLQLGCTSHVHAMRVLFDRGGYAEQRFLAEQPQKQPELATIRENLQTAGFPVPMVEAKTRYHWLKGQLASVIQRPSQRPRTTTDRLDAILTHKLWGTLIFLLVMAIIFQLIFAWSGYFMAPIEQSQEWLSNQVEKVLSPGSFRSLIIDGMINGVGSVLIFLPQICLLFGVIAVLEDCGYMARAAFLMDKLMSRCGLNGKSFIPMLSSVACAVPGIMATRVIENKRDRFATILVAPLMSCSARLPVYTLVIWTFLRDPIWLPGLVLFGAYMIGFVTAPLVALVLKRTLLKGEAPVFIMEMPPYRRPQIGSIVRRMSRAGTAFVVRAGTMIFAAVILIWASLYYPTVNQDGQSYPEQIQVLEEKLELEPENEEFLTNEINRVKAEWREKSYLGRTGKAMEPIFAPLGWDWKTNVAVLSSFPAREVIVGTMGMLYQQGDVDPGDIQDADDPGTTPLSEAIKSEWEADPLRSRYRIPIALGVIVFFALCCQCVSTLAVIRRETKSWFWPTFTFVYMTVLAYVATLVVVQVGKLIIGGG